MAAELTGVMGQEAEGDELDPERKRRKMMLYVRVAVGTVQSYSLVSNTLLMPFLLGVSILPQSRGV